MASLDPTHLPFARLRNVLWKCVFAVHDHGESFAVIGFLERSRPTDQHVQDNTQRPNV